MIRAADGPLDYAAGALESVTTFLGQNRRVAYAIAGKSFPPIHLSDLVIGTSSGASSIVMMYDDSI